MRSCSERTILHCVESYLYYIERRINRVHLQFSLYDNCQNRPCGKKFNTTAFVNLHILITYMFKINAMRSCSERTILHCVESYLYYIILVNKKIIFTRQNSYI
jgi:hypothetical protein